MSSAATTDGEALRADPQLHPLAHWLQEGIHSEVILVVLRWLPAPTLIRVSRTCRRLHELATSEHLWLHRLSADFGQACRALPPLLNLSGDWGAPPTVDPHGLGLGFGLCADSPPLPQLPPSPSWRYAETEAEVRHTFAALASRCQPESEARFSHDYAATLPVPQYADFLAQLRPQQDQAPDIQQSPSAHGAWMAWHQLVNSYDQHLHAMPFPSDVLGLLQHQVEAGLLRLPPGFPTLRALWAHLLARAMGVATALAPPTRPRRRRSAPRGRGPRDLDPHTPIDVVAMYVASRYSIDLDIGCIRVYDMSPTLTIDFFATDEDEGFGEAEARSENHNLKVVGRVLDPSMGPYENNVLASIVYDREHGALGRRVRATGPVLEPVSPYTGLDSFLHWLEHLSSGLGRGIFAWSDDDGMVSLFPRSGPTVSRAVTRGIETRASPVPFSHPHVGAFATSYGIHLRLLSLEQQNVEEKPVQQCILRTRHWKIKIGDAPVNEVNGPGVIGLYPDLKAGGPEFQYASLTSGPFWRNEPRQSMSGAFRFQTSDRELIDAAIAPFKLVPFPYRWL